MAGRMRKPGATNRDSDSETADNRPLLHQIYLSYKQKNIVCLALPLRLTITYYFNGDLEAKLSYQ